MLTPADNDEFAAQMRAHRREIWRSRLSRFVSRTVNAAIVAIAFLLAYVLMP